MIRFRIDRRSGLPAYRQLVNQVREALQLGILHPGDQLPTVREAVQQIGINPNTVHRAYRELEHQGLTEGRPGQGTFVVRTLARMPERQPALRRLLEAWVTVARQAGLDDDAIHALVSAAIRDTECPDDPATSATPASPTSTWNPTKEES